MRAVGFLAGVGSLLREAEDQGYEILGNIETRSYFRSSPWTWNANFTAPFLTSIDEVPDDWRSADIALGHPPCGSFSHLGGSGARVERFKEEADREQWHKDRLKDLGLIPQFIELVNTHRPKMFALDNLPRLLKAFDEEDWRVALPGYQLSFLEILNWDYGCSQRRKRLWVVGVRTKKYRNRFQFKPPTERLEGPTTIGEALADFPWQPWIDLPEIDHVHQATDARPMGGFWARDVNGERFHLSEMTQAALGYMALPPGYLWPYQNVHGRHTKKPGQARMVSDRPSRTPTGNETLRHPLSGWPLTVRERARIMGWPDDFRLTTEGFEWNRTNILKLVRLTGRAVPSEFPRYLIKQMTSHIQKIFR